MIIGFDAIEGSPFDERNYIDSMDDFYIDAGLIDEVYIDEDINYSHTLEKPKGWRFTTILNGKFKESMEAGSIQSKNGMIDTIKIQKRRSDEMEWEDFATIPYNQGDKIYYEELDRYVANDFEYQYSIVPVANDVQGIRVVSDLVRASFEGVFISDAYNNYHMLYNLEFDDITKNFDTHVFEPLASKYPVVVHSQKDYDTMGITGTFITTETFEECDRQVNIRAERLAKDKLFTFLKNGKPKIYKDHHGNIKLVTLIDNPIDHPSSVYGGISDVSFNVIEIGDIDSDTLKSYGLLSTFNGVF